MPPPTSSSASDSGRSHGRGSQSRSQSPKKQFIAMQMATEPVTFCSFNENDTAEFPEELKGMLLKIRKYSRGLAVIAKTHENEVAMCEDDCYDGAFTSPDDLPGISPTLKVCKTILQLAQACEDGLQDEAAWNSGPHSSILQAAIQDGFQGAVGYPHITTARIEPDYLMKFECATVQPRKIDFVIYSEHTPEKLLRMALAKQARRCIGTAPVCANHTSHVASMWKPISVSIETKRTGEQWLEAKTQVGAWAAAHFKKLEELMQQARHLQPMSGSSSIESMPTLPLIIAQGHHWNFLVAIRGVTEPETTIYHAITFGSSNTILGIYQIITTLQLLARWTQTTYLPWFLKNCVPDLSPL